MEQLVTRISNLLCIKSIVTLTLTAVFAWMCLHGLVSVDQFLTVFTVVIGFYFGTQAERKANKKVVLSEKETTTEEVKA